MNKESKNEITLEDLRGSLINTFKALAELYGEVYLLEEKINMLVKNNNLIRPSKLDVEEIVKNSNEKMQKTFPDIPLKIKIEDET